MGRDGEMDVYDSTVKLARALQVGDTLIGVDRNGEHLYEVLEVTHVGGQVTVVTMAQTVTLDSRDAVRVAHPDIPISDPARSTSSTNAT